MALKTVRVHLDISSTVSGENRDRAHRCAEEAAVLALWEAGEISTREAAAELELQYGQFVDLLTSRNIPVVPEVTDADALEAARAKCCSA